RDWPKNAGAAWIQIFIDNHDCIVIEAQQRTILPPDRLPGPNEYGTHHFALLYRPGCTGFLDVGSNHVANPCVTRGFADHANHGGHARAAIVRNVQSGSNLYHKIDCYFWMTSTRRHRFNLLSGRVSMMRTLSPVFSWFCSSCA